MTQPSPKKYLNTLMGYFLLNLTKCVKSLCTTLKKLVPFKISVDSRLQLSSLSTKKNQSQII